MLNQKVQKILFTEESGSTLAEFSLMSALIALACVTSVTFLGSSSAAGLESTGSAMSQSEEIASGLIVVSDLKKPTSQTVNNPDEGEMTFQDCPNEICSGN